MKHIIAFLSLFFCTQVSAHNEPIGSIEHSFYHADYIGIFIFSLTILIVATYAFKKIISNIKNSNVQEKLKISPKNRQTNNLGA
tara:strand:+ start:323 stop:574 length:252 start_codon:yes stop_codon:yes gene_type:complete